MNKAAPTIGEQTKRRRISVPSEDSTRNKILDAAEELFGERSFDTVSLRDITQKADVTLALSSYHFGTKEKLFSEVVVRRATELCRLRQERLAMLEGVLALTAENVLDAFMRPLLEKLLAEEKGWPAYLQILAQLSQTNRWLPLLHDNFDPMAELFLDKLATTLPDVSRPLLMRGFTLIMILMVQTVSKNRRIDALSGGKVTIDNLLPAYEVLLKFSTRGLEGLSDLKKKPNKLKKA